ncbi:MAG: DUF3344 domain-containing protein, partial [Candidatus Syntrophoarchaeum sp.]|nr:DUF3344 domain-containing protein [Candidatus Syntrophoarchaeum sp.]
KVGEPNYRATKPLTVFSDTVDGGVYYDASGSYQSYNGSGSYPPTTFDNRLPDGATPVRARLYLYMWGRKEDPEHANYFLGKLPNVVNMEFIVSENSHSVGKFTSPISKEFPDATRNNYTYATYAYDIQPSILNTIDANDSLKARVSFDNGTGVEFYAVSGMGLFVAYKDYSNGLLTKYYIGEGGDIIMARNNIYPTGFEYGNCTSNVNFDDVEDPQLANATLITVLSEYTFHTPIEPYPINGVPLPLCDLLRFNGKDMEEPLFEPNGEVHYWKYHTVGDIALRRNELWGERGDYVDVQGSNTAEIQSRGSYFFLTNAFLNVSYPPDLEPWLEKTSLQATVGNPYDIPITINNWGKSDAKDFNVSISIDGEHVKDETITEINGVGLEGSSKTLKITMPRAPPVECSIKHNVTVVVDPEEKVKELVNKYGRGKRWESNGEANNNWTGEVTVVVESGEPIPPKHPGGGGGGTGGGWGEGTGTGEGAGEGEGTGTGGAGGEGAVGETGGKAITGYLMKGSAVSGEEGGGGGKGEFSLVALLLRLVMLAAAVVLVCAGYLMERRRQNNKL